jgi:hypothetical protein
MMGIVRVATMKDPTLPKRLQFVEARLSAGIGRIISMRLVLLILFVFLAVRPGHSTERVVQEEISISRALAGHVLVPGTDEPADGVTVELFSPDWKKVLTSTKTDKRGYFSLEQPKTGKLFYIRVSAPGMDIYELRVRIKKQAAQELTIRLPVAT